MTVAIVMTEDELRALIAQEIAAALAERDGCGPNSGFLTPAQAAEVAHVSPRTVQNWLSRGVLTRYGRPRLPLVSRAELMAFLAAPRPETPPAAPKRARTAAARSADRHFRAKARAMDAKPTAGSTE